MGGKRTLAAGALRPFCLRRPFPGAKCSVKKGGTMPFRKAWLYVLLLLGLTFVAFWPGYFSKLPVKKLAHHYHAASAVLWMILAIGQSWTAHQISSRCT